MVQMNNFKNVEVVGATKEEAFANTPFTAPIEYWVNATAAFNNWRKKQTGAVTEAMVKQFKADYLASKKVAPGAAAYIVVESAVKNTRERSYTIEDIKNEGTRKAAKVFQLIDDATGKVLAETEATEVPMVDENGVAILDKDGNPRMRISAETKARAKELGRELYSNGYTGDLHCDMTKQVIKGQRTVFRMRYTPSKNTKPGVYQVFGYEA